jgi:hypothetical protein
MHTLTGSQEALDVLLPWARWFHRWTGKHTRADMDAILDVETGGMLEAWADLYGVTGAPEHRELMERYDRPRLFDKLLAGEDVLTNRHANTTIPEVQGAARAWEVTGEARWRSIVEAYWRMAVTDRGFFCTGGQTNGEFWTPPGELAARRSATNQEHCVVYNMMRLAEYLLRWTGDSEYADYWERNLCNGILAQQHPVTGQVAYFLPLAAGGKKAWGSPTEDFWCCHGTLVQSHPTHVSAVFYEDAAGLVVEQYLPSTLAWKRGSAKVQVDLKRDRLVREIRRPRADVVELEIRCAERTSFGVALRVPWWVAGPVKVELDGVSQDAEVGRDRYLRLSRTWEHNRMRVTLPRALSSCPLPDEPDTVAFMDGPVVLAGLCDEERLVRKHGPLPETMLAPDNEREFDNWLGGWRLRGQERVLRFAPLHEIADERYTVYFPVAPPTEPSPGARF